MRALLLGCLALVSACDGVFRLVHVNPDARPGPDGPDMPLVDAYAGEIPDLVVWYPLDFADGGTVLELENSHHGACTGNACPVPTEGVVGAALRFDGINDIVQVDGHAHFETTQGFTVAAWMKLDIALAVDEIACGISKQHAVAQFNNTYQLCATVDSLHFVSWDSVGQTADYTTTVVFAPDEWHHVAMRYNGTAKTLVVDGIAGLPKTANITFDGSGLTIGGDIDDRVVAPWVGSIDDVRIYSRALELHELSRLATP